MQKEPEKFHQNREGSYRIFADPSLHLQTLKRTLLAKQ